MSDLQALKLRLADIFSPSELPSDQAKLISTEISAIRLQLKRLEFERAAIADELARSLDLRP